MVGLNGLTGDRNLSATRRRSQIHKQSHMPGEWTRESWRDWWVRCVNAVRMQAIRMPFASLIADQYNQKENRLKAMRKTGSPAFLFCKLCNLMSLIVWPDSISVRFLRFTGVGLQRVLAACVQSVCVQSVCSEWVFFVVFRMSSLSSTTAISRPLCHRQV